MPELPLVVYSHLRWDSVYQRPQHLVSRLSRRRLVLFVEEPVAAEAGVPDSWDVQFATPRLRICRPVLSADGDGGFAGGLERLAKMMTLLLRWQEVGDHVAWLYTPMAWPLARSLSPELVVYDDSGAPYTVRYHLLVPLLLAELQRQHAEIEELRRSMAGGAR